MKNKYLTVSSAILSLISFSGLAQNEANPLNVVLITADDLNYSSVGYMGCPIPEITPNLDELASEGIVFNNAYVNIAVSQPSRAVLATGLYSHKNGVEGFYHTEKQIPTVMSVLREHGYKTGIAGKLGHSTPIASFQWDMQVDQPDLGAGRDPKRYYEVFNQFVKDSKNSNKPFYFMVNSHDPHAPFHGSDREKIEFPKKNFPNASRVYTAEEMIVPGFIINSQKAKIELAQYYSSVRRLDDVVGEIMRVLKEQGLENNTLVMFLSDNGMDFPFAKTNCYLNSNKTPWIVKWPGVTKPGSIDNSTFIATIDYMPTILEACGIELNASVDGKSFVEVLKGHSLLDRNRVFTQFYETSGRNRYPMFAVHDAQYCYIYNAWADGNTVFRNCSWAGMTFASMVEDSESDGFTKQRLEFFKFRTKEELYDVKKDPEGLHNLLEDDKYKEIVQLYRLYLQEWMETTDSPVLDIFKNKDNEELRRGFMKEQQNMANQRKTKK